ncbi:PREDICTED: uncharacterized protein LOC108686135 [Atta colombica]|uniref:uncharacterized protein LOC108686135 n=1 Tax=Atta colombica TaxID=520822 RepID=UPI00084C1F80|nr:PREDICTED: uncharacterized protein LOC108686135 [Atta colombica]
MLLVLLRARVYISASRICRNVSCRLEAESERTWTYSEAKSGAKRSGATRRGATLSLSIIFPRYRTVVEAAVASDRLRTISATPDCASAFFLYLPVFLRTVFLRRKIIRVPQIMTVTSHLERALLVISDTPQVLGSKVAIADLASEILNAAARVRRRRS